MAIALERRLPPLTMTEDEFVAWCDSDTKAEFVDGRVIIMSPVVLDHDNVFHFLLKLLGMYLEYRPVGELHGSEYTVRLRPGLRRVPDLLFVASGHTGRLTRGHLEGAPDAAFEIVSEESVERDWREKFEDYRAAGVSEYWIIDPAHSVVRLHTLSRGRYKAVEERDGRLHSAAIPDFRIRPEWLWQRPMPGVLACLRELGVL